MKREFLLGLKAGEEALPKEVIDAIMAENGRDIQKVKAGFADYEDLKNQLAEIRENHAREIARLNFDHLLETGIQKMGGRNAKAITALLDVDALHTSENQAEAVREALEAVKQENQYLFAGEVPPPYAQRTGAGFGIKESIPTTLAGALREKFERK